MMALSICLSVTYEIFSDGESVQSVNTTHYTGNALYYSLFTPSGLHSFGEQIGIFVFNNAILVHLAGKMFDLH